MIDENTEVRRLTPRFIVTLSQILDEHEGWEILMSRIPETYDSLDDGYVDKYSVEDIRLIKKAAIDRGCSCTEILLEEWGTSGRKRPTIRTLQNLLIKAKLFRAADFVAEELLKEPPPERPKDGPESRIPLTDSTKDQEITESLPSVCNENTIQCEELDEIRGNFALQYNDERSPFGEESGGRTNRVDGGVGLDKRDQKINYVNYEKIKTITCNFDQSLKLGSGAFGSVFLGKLDDKKVAIKVLSIFDNDSNLLEHFKNELVILYECSEHPNILPLLGASSDRIPCLIYEFMPNGSLEKRLACDLEQYPPLTWKKRVFIANNITEGLEHLHKLSIIHRDIKAANVLLDSNDIAKIGDFGLVRKFKNRETSNTALIQGTSVYMAPEALRGTVSPKMDIFSFGVLLLELLTGLPAYHKDGENGEALIDYVAEVVDKDDDFVTLLDEKAGICDTEIWTEMYTLFKKCTLREKKWRPNTEEVSADMRSLREKFKN